MNLEEAKAIGEVVATADGGCSTCVAELCDLLNERFSNFLWKMQDGVRVVVIVTHKNVSPRDYFRRVIKPINKYFALVKYGDSIPRVDPNPFEMAKQYVIMHASKCHALPLPRMAYNVCEFEDDYPDLVKWFAALDYQNPPSKIDFSSNPGRFRDLVEPLDFSKPFDAAAVDKIQVEFATQKTKMQISADDLISAELNIQEGAEND